ncbi:hypothetical protein J6590_101827, partial [Homalodisca vitripennis]
VVEVDLGWDILREVRSRSQPRERSTIGSWLPTTECRTPPVYITRSSLWLRFGEPNLKKYVLEITVVI